MIRKLVIACSILLSASASAAPNWIQAASTDAGTILLDRSSVARVGEFQSIHVLRSHDRLINLGLDPITQEAWYPHRSVNLRYLVDCGSGKVGFDAWQMYSGHLGDGEIVWADHVVGAPSFATPESDEESSALEMACSKPAAKSLASLIPK